MTTKPPTLDEYLRRAALRGVRTHSLTVLRVGTANAHTEDDTIRFRLTSEGGEAAGFCLSDGAVIPDLTSAGEP